MSTRQEITKSSATSLPFPQVSITPIRPSGNRRSFSDNTTTRSRVRVQIIEEGGAIQWFNRPEPNQSLQNQREKLQHASDGEVGTSASAASTASSIRTTSKRLVGLSDRKDVPTTNKLDTAAPLRRTRPGYKWSRTCSGGVWYEKPRGSSSYDQNSSASYNSHSNDVELDPKVLIPLRPPFINRGQSESNSSVNQIIVETPFTSLNFEAKGEISAKKGPIESRRSSINPKHLFSAPFLVVRKFHRPKQKSISVPPVDEAPCSHTSERNLADHRSQLKRNYTANALHRVSSILRETSSERSSLLSRVSLIRPLRIRTFSHHSSASRKLNRQQTPQMVQGIIAPVIEHEQESIGGSSDIVSNTSSLQRLKMGAPLNNTPDENATYKVKRSPSAETEEFLRVDISIRGGTSYLPSEARRIHTPPLPDEAGRKRKGFFFDYYPPVFSDMPRSIPITQPNLQSKSATWDMPMMRSTSKATTIGQKWQPRSMEFERSCTRDWYDAKLAEIDTAEDEMDQPGMKIECLLDKCKKGLGDAAIQSRAGKLAEEEFDLTIPEHLPTSPLCPRHPRYWRIVKGRGSQFRGCWMHGVGMYADENS